MGDKKRIYTLKEIADELQIDKQKVYRWVIRNHISEVQPSDVVGIQPSDVVGCTLDFDADFLKKSAKYYDETTKMRICQAFGMKSTSESASESTSKSTSSTSDDTPDVHHDVEENTAENQSEMEFLRCQILRMNEYITTQNEQVRQQGEMINSLHRELEKEREHNREKDKLLIETLSKLADTQAALAVGQSAEKQKELAETLIEGQQKIENVQPEPPDSGYGDFEEEFHDTPKKRGWLRRVWNAIRGNDL